MTNIVFVKLTGCDSDCMCEVSKDVLLKQGDVVTVETLTSEQTAVCLCDSSIVSNNFLQFLAMRNKEELPLKKVTKRYMWIPI